MKKGLLVKSALVVLAFFAMYYGFGEWVFSFLPELLPENRYVQAVVSKFIYYSPVILISGVLFYKELPQLLGLRHSPLKSFGLALVFALPMYLLFPFFFGLNAEPEGFYIFKSSLLAAFFEELVFRVLVFGTLFVVCQWRFFPAVLLNAIVFGLGHLSQAPDISGAVMAFAVTFGGAVWFAWLYVKWDYNLYVPVFLHFLMNLSWHLFEINSGAAGGGITNVARLLTIFLSIMLTMRFAGGKQVFSWKSIRLQKPSDEKMAVG